MYVNKSKESQARVMVRKVTKEGEKVDEMAVKQAYKMLGGLVREEEVVKPKRKTAKKVAKKVVKVKKNVKRNNKSTKKSK